MPGPSAVCVASTSAYQVRSIGLGLGDMGRYGQEVGLGPVGLVKLHQRSVEPMVASGRVDLAALTIPSGEELDRG